MDFSILYNSFSDFFLGDSGSVGDVFFSFHKGGYLLEDARFQTENKAKENLSKACDCAQMFSQNLHYFSRIDKVFSSLYKTLLVDQSQAFIPDDASTREEERIQQEFANCKSRATHAFEVFGDLASEYGPTTYKAAQFEPLMFANDNQYWQQKDFTLTFPGNAASTTISFEYVKVKVTYPWYDEALLKYKNWFVRDQYAGEALMQGIYALPHSMVVIRNLAITGQWNSETIVTPGIVDTYNPFNYPGSTTPISEKRMQIAGWIFEKLPSVPPVSDPNRRVPRPISLLDKAQGGFWSCTVLNPGAPFPAFTPIPWSPQIINAPFAQVGKDSIVLEDFSRHTALRTWPPPMPGGCIRGGIGPISITSSATFSAKVGFAQQMLPPVPLAPTGIQVYVTQLDASGNLLSRDGIYTGNKSHNGSLIDIEADMSKFLGKNVYIELDVYSGDTSTLYWVDPKITFA